MHRIGFSFGRKTVHLLLVFCHDNLFKSHTMQAKHKTKIKQSELRSKYRQQEDFRDKKRDRVLPNNAVSS